MPRRLRCSCLSRAFPRACTSCRSGNCQKARSSFIGTTSSDPCTNPDMEREFT